MTKYRLDLAYDGSGFRGYAKQLSLRTVQGELEDALARLVGGELTTAVAGRTDAGVHARAQVVSFETELEIEPERMIRSLNGLLGPEVSVTAVAEVDDGFHARFSAKQRTYRYLMDPRPSRDPLLRHMVWHVGAGLDVEAMSLVAQAVVGEHDFGSFCRSMEGKSNVRHVDAATLEVSEGLLVFWIEANAFCHQMVRSIVGHMYDVGRGFASGHDIDEVIAARDRSTVATVAPPHGLTLWKVTY